MNSELENEFEGDAVPLDPGNSGPENWTLTMNDQELAEVHELLGLEGGE